jgi:hypothetical protein
MLFMLTLMDVLATKVHPSCCVQADSEPEKDEHGVAVPEQLPTPPPPKSEALMLMMSAEES